MPIILSPEHERVIDQAVRSGAFHNSSEVLDQAFEIIRAEVERGDWMLEHREAISARIEKGFAEAEQGELIDGDVAMEILRQRRAARIKS